MSKPTLVVSCPIDTYSGYGARARDFVQSIIDTDKYDVQILSQRWGNTRFGYLKDHRNESLHSRIITQLTQQPDIWIQITVPNEFQAVGKFNIGVTAGIETTLCAPQWVDGVNRMNLTLVSSEHAKKVFLSSSFEEKNNQTGQVVRSLKVEKPIEVLFEGANTDIYKKLDSTEGEVTESINDLVKEDFNYLFVGHWLQGEIGHDRKDVGMLIKTFLETFKNKKQRPGLILKTQSATSSVILKTSQVTNSIMDRDAILLKIRSIEESIEGNLPSIYLLHGELSDKEVNELYNHPKVKAHVTFTKGEGYGRPLLEASITGKPVIAPKYSGHLDFLDEEMSILLPGQITQLHPSSVVQDMLIPESGWFTVDYKKAADTLEDVYKNYKKYNDGAKRQSYRSRTAFSLDEMSNLLLTILENKVPKPVELKLPKLQKIELPKKPL